MGAEGFDRAGRGSAARPGKAEDAVVGATSPAWQGSASAVASTAPRSDMQHGGWAREDGKRIAGEPATHAIRCSPPYRRFT